MATTPNQKAVPSEDYANMRFNAGKLDEFISSTINTYVDRLGVTHMTVKGLQVAALGALMPANNLSDVASVSTSRTNLGAAASGANADITSITGLTTPLSVTQGGTGNTTGLAATATILATARTFQTNLSGTSAVTFNGSANNLHGVTGTLPLTNGGTGATTAAAARTSLGAASSAGVTDASSAATGAVGEVLTAQTLTQSLTNATATNVAALSLTAGDWDVSGIVRFNSSSATYTAIVAGLTTTSSTQALFPDTAQISGSLSGASQAIPVPTKRVNISATTIIYIVAVGYFPSGTTTTDGFIKARRVR